MVTRHSSGGSSSKSAGAGRTPALHPARLTFLFLALCTSLPAAPVDYLRDVKPILLARCQGCHGALRQRGGLRLDAARLIHRGGKGGPAVKPGRSADSLLVARVTGAGGLRRMPPEDEGEPLGAGEVEVLKAWIDGGAIGPAEEPVAEDSRLHWAFQPAARPPVPEADDPAWGSNPVDAFLADAHRRQGLRASPPVSGDLWLRRVYLDLIGLPPTPEELHAFRAERSRDAHEQVVDRLLASKHYGERWGRHWMDVWRYSDWFGLGKEVRFSQPHIWRWRDWIVESLNADKGYDRMVVEMLAGDEVAPADPDTLRATGFLARNWYIFNRNVMLDEAIEHVGRGFLGLTLQCARCHDHKYDPIAQGEYYQLRAFLEPHHVRIDRVPGEPDRTKAGLPRVFDAFLDAPTYLFVRGDEGRPDRSAPLFPAVPPVLGGSRVEIRPLRLPLAAYCPDKREFVIQEALAASEEAVDRSRSDLETARRAPALDPEDVRAAESSAELAEARRTALKAVIRMERLQDAGVKEDDPEAWTRAALEASAAQGKLAVEEAKHERLLARRACERAAGKAEEARGKLAAAEAKLARAEAEARKPPTTSYAPRPLEYPRAPTRYNEPPANEAYPRVSSGRRLALARWITDGKNPLTARVAVNHIWARHFGEPLVRSVFDFGLRTRRPAHHQLLDWLAVELMDSGWSQKRLHRLLVLSQAYRMSSASRPDDPNAVIDPDNRYLWRRNARRMEGEVIRDSLLHLAGKLDRRLGGPDLPVAEADAGRRRTIYYRYARDDRIPFLTVFDAPSVQECYLRHETIVPQQALVMANSRMVLTRAGEVAEAIELAAGAGSSAAAFIASAFERILSRPPTDEERARCEESLAALADLFAAEGDPAPPARARASLVHVLLNHNDFITIR